MTEPCGGCGSVGAVEFDRLVSVCEEGEDEECEVGVDIHVP